MLTPLAGVAAPPLLAAPPPACLVAPNVRFRRNKVSRDLRMSYEVLKEGTGDPVGNKKLPPGVRLGNRTGEVAQYRRLVHMPEDGKYTIAKLTTTKLAGRDPYTGQKICGGIGGGSKQKYRWVARRLPVEWAADRGDDGEDLVEKVIALRYDPCRDSVLALAAHAEQLRWLIATSNMREGDLIRTSTQIPENPVRPVEGDSYPLGALPQGTRICQVQLRPGYDPADADTDMRLALHGGASIEVRRKIGDRVIVQLPGRKHAKPGTKHEISLDERCQCIVGSTSIHPLKAMPIGSPNRLRWLGHAPRSGLWKRKTGIHGKKIKAPPPLMELPLRKLEPDPILRMTCISEGWRGRCTAYRKNDKAIPTWKDPRAR